MKKRHLLIRVYGDSLSMPRSFDGIRHFEIYPELLRDSIEAADPETRVTVYHRSKGGASIASLYEQFIHDTPYFEHSNPGILIIQCGIVDCAPRPIPPSLKTLIGRLPSLLRWPIVRVLHFGRPVLLRIGLKWQNTDPDTFQATLTEWLSVAQKSGSRVYVSNIFPTIQSVASHSPGLQASIELYNLRIQAAVTAAKSSSVKLIDVYSKVSHSAETSSHYLNQTDGHHITAVAHVMYADMIHSFESQYLTQSLHDRAAASTGAQPHT